MIKNLLSLISILSFITIFSQQNKTLTSFPGYQDMLGKPFSVKQFNNDKGIKFNIDNLIGKSTLINFWSTICEPCIEEMPALNQLEKDMNGKVNFI
jgi:thiol-disulfide isomerase/thioredoxin